MSELKEKISLHNYQSGKSILILTEKPSVAMAISKALGGYSNKLDGYLTVDQYIITWAIGHLVGLAEPQEYNEQWKTWSFNHLPMIPDHLQLVVNRRVAKQFKIVKELMNSKNINSIIFATDAGPQGELIARWIYHHANCKKPILRLWISSITKESILNGLNNLRPAEDYDPIYHAAQSQARADWIVGLNATRAVTLHMQSQGQKSAFSVGRVQTPTLKKIVDREKEIREFEPQIYYEIVANFLDSNGQEYSAKWFDPINKTSRIRDRNTAEQIIAEVLDKKSERIEENVLEVVVERPTLHSLPLLQQQLSTKLNIKIAVVDEALQDLYESGLITYPRTADILVTPDVVIEFPKILNALQSRFSEYIPLLPLNLTSDRKYVGGVTDHHAIIPTLNIAKLDGIKAKIYEHIAKTFIAVHHPDGIDLRKEIFTDVRGHIFITKEQIVKIPGWRSVWDVEAESFKHQEIAEPAVILSVECIENKTNPPSRYTESSLIKEMEKCNLGTPATRTDIIEKLYTQTYITPINKTITPTEKAELHVNQLTNTILVSAEMTSEWERKLGNIRNGKLKSPEFDQEIDEFIQEFIEQFKTQNNVKYTSQKVDKESGKVLGVCPKCKEGSIINKSTIYGCNRYPECRFFISGRIAEADIIEEDVMNLLRKGYTPFKNFRFKPGKKSKARIILNKQGETSFDFQKTGILNRIRGIFSS
ncbi:hypothetical protein BHU72_14790 [Desulfuribacillus stibiiarsenatis]|uniref:DNA topoisomerase n=1 Tax=Desulfuribacillus stibiiarsenatis TaxID=1390249 RepID=A0A1E5L790_9FIRM|nr:type IA DNA topoisomerase [Desulfuribacillus stibiiarsenatis]OEH86017.1 hypothetical protein BHU72_14790 [Desulfuribacillus stibiiarsenatis]